VFLSENIFFPISSLGPLLFTPSCISWIFMVTRWRF